MTYDEISKYTPNEDFLLVRKCGPGVRQADGTRLAGGLYLPENYERECWQNWCELIDVGPRCEYFRRELGHHARFPERGVVVWVQDGASEEWCLDRGLQQECEFWEYRESHIQPWYIADNNIHVLGDFVLVATTWIAEQEGVLLSDWSQHYELRGRVIACGPQASRKLGIDLPLGAMVTFEERVRVFKLAGKYMALVPAKIVSAVIEA